MFGHLRNVPERVAPANPLPENNKVAATDTILFSHASGGTLGAYTFMAQCGSGTVNLAITNISTGALNEQPVIQFTLQKGTTN